MEQNISWDANGLINCLEIPCIIWYTNFLITLLIRLLHWSLSWSSWILSKLLYPVSLKPVCAYVSKVVCPFMFLWLESCVHLSCSCAFYIYNFIQCPFTHCTEFLGLNPRYHRKKKRKLKKTDEMILNSCRLIFQVNKINIHGSM
jgi:hypothetical protein